MNAYCSNEQNNIIPDISNSGIDEELYRQVVSALNCSEQVVGPRCDMIEGFSSNSSFWFWFWVILAIIIIYLVYKARNNAGIPQMPATILGYSLQ